MTEMDTGEADGQTVADRSAGTTTAAPYMPFKTLLNLLDRFREEGGPPAVLDKSYFGGTSGSVVAQNRSGLRYFDLIDDDYVPTDTLTLLVDATEDERKSYLKGLIEAKYTDALALSPNATQGQLDKVFQERGLTGATVAKAVSFYLSATEYVGINVSPHFKKRRVSSGNGTRRRRPAAKAQASPLPTPPTPQVMTEEQQKVKYVDMLMDLASKDTTGDSQKDLLDRIEKALGIGGGD